MQKSCLSHCCLESQSLASMFAKNYNDVFNNYNTLSSIAQEGVSPLFMASQNGHTQVVELLLREGADPNLTRTVCILMLLLYLLHVI